MFSKNTFTTRPFSLVLALILLASVVSAVFAAAGDTTHVSRSTGGAVGNGASTAPVLSADGRYIAFNSGSSNLVTGDTNANTDVFLRDTQSNTTIRVSVATDGTEGEFDSGYPSISADGRYVAFHSNANNLVPNDTNGGTDVFVRDTQTNTTIIASLDHQGNFANLASSLHPSISADGRYVAFESDAILTAGDTNFATDIYVRDLQTNTIHLISVASDGTQGDNNSNSPAISADGRYVAFRSVAYNLVPGDTNGVNDIFLRDRQTNTTTRISVATDGTQANYNTGSWQCPLSISGDGRYVVFESNASNLVDGDSNSSRDIFLRDTQTDATTILSVTPDWAVGNGDSLCPSISADGRYVNFFSFASNLVANDTNSAPDVFVRDIQYGITKRVSVASDGTQATGWSQHSAISSDGSVVAFSSYAVNLVASVTGQQVFKHELGWAPAPPPSVISIKRANANPTSATTVDFKVTFSQYVSGVDASDFDLSTSGVTGAEITNVSGSNNIYTVTVSTGTGSGSIRLDLLDDDSIINAASLPLGGNGAGNGNFTSGETYTVNKSQTTILLSQASSDGWILETSETSNKGGTLNKSASTLNVGDDAANKQYRAILSFDTTLPEGAVITGATLKFKYAGKTGTLPFSTHGKLLVDVKKGAFSNNPALQKGDFNAGANKNALFSLGKSTGWFTKMFSAGQLTYINTSGVTQFRLRFAKDDNNDFDADFLKIHSGNASEANRPQLIVEYYVP
jgi:Tol biopolymer transport system component